MSTGDATATPMRARDVVVGLFAEQKKLWRRAWSLPRVFEVARNTQVGTTPHDVVLEERTYKLLRYRRDTPASYPIPILFCYALVNRPYILDLQPDRSVVRQYLAQGFDVYLIDWGTPSDADRTLTLEDYVCRFLQNAVSLVLETHRRQQLHLLGYCMGGTLAALFSALNPELVTTLTLLAAPIDFSNREALLNLWADPKYFDVDAFVDAYGNCPGWFLQSCFLSMSPVQSFLGKSIAFMEQMEDPRMVSNFFAMERWLNDNIPVAGETFRKFVKELYQGNQLVRGQFHLRNAPVDLGRITCPLLLLTAKSDHLVAPASTEGIRRHVGTSDIRSMSIDAGHVGMVVGGKAQKTFWPEATRWLADRSAEPDAGLSAVT